MLNLQNIMVSIQRPLISNLPIYQYNNVIVFDLACENTEELLKQVRRTQTRKEKKRIVVAE